jgi:lipopolysaccharide cholinephosphotransferase
MTGMLQFDEGFFDEEERSGFVVCETMKRAWAAELEVLALVDGICKKHGITYYADWGTLLGAVRHGGFVPWDDDIDICMKRPDYMRFVSVLGSELPKGYHVSSLYAEGNHMQPITCVMNAERLPLADEVKQRFHGCPYIVRIDVYPLDYLPEDTQTQDVQIAMYNAVYDLAQRYSTYENEGTAEMYIEQVEQMCSVKVERGAFVRRNLWRLGDRICSMFTEDESSELTQFPRLVRGDAGYHLRKEWYGEVVMMPFENMELPVPVGYDEILTRQYGDYRTPKKGSMAHGYPFYAGQEEYLRGL